jgi:site-specific DNA recombinase
MEAAPTIQRIALYARVSSEEQREGQTIDSQIAELERFAKERCWVVTDTYRDEGWSGGIIARPNMDRLRDDASKKIFDAVLINDVDRLARDVAHLGVIKRDLERKGVQLIFRKLPSENSPMRNLMVNILGSFAEFEKELIADRTRRGRRHKAEVRKVFVGSLPPFGYDYIPRGPRDREGIFRVNPQEAIVVRQMYKWADEEGLSARKIALRLTEMGVRPRKGGQRWAKSSVLRILRSEVYAGTWYYNKLESYEPIAQGRNRTYRRSLKSSHRPRSRADWVPVPLAPELKLVAMDSWKRVQACLTQNTAFSPRNSKHSYLLRGLVRCAGCNARFVGDPDHNRFAYRCHRRCKKVRSIGEEPLNTAVWSAVKEALLNPDLIVESVAALQQRDEKHTENVGVELANVERSITQLRAEEARILEAYRREIISTDQLADQMQQLKSNKSVLENVLQNSPKERPQRRLSKTSIREAIAQFCEQITTRLTSLAPVERQQLIRLVVNEIVFDGSTATIHGVIPTKNDPGAIEALGLSEFAATGSQSHGRSLASTGDIAPMAPWRHGHNRAMEFVITRSISNSTDLAR